MRVALNHPTKGRGQRDSTRRCHRDRTHEKHWHGASLTTAMTHIAIQERLDGRAAEWMEHVADEQYQAGL